MVSEKAIEAAMYLAMNGVSTANREERKGVGRPSDAWIVNGIRLKRDEYEIYQNLAEFWERAKNLDKRDIMTDEQFVAFQKAAAPLLTKRMIDMALVSDSLKDVRQVASDLADRGYGKAASQININISDKDIRGAWKQLESTNIIDVTNLIEVDDASD